MRACCVALILLLSLASAFAQTDPSQKELAAARAELEAQIRTTETALRRIRAEQQSIYQQFQMAQEMRRNAWQEILNPPQVYTPPGSPANYEDVLRDKQAREQRLQYYMTQMDRLYARYRELEDQAQPLVEQLANLTAQR